MFRKTTPPNSVIAMDSNWSNNSDRSGSLSDEMFENPADRFIPGTLRDTLTSTQKAAAAMKGVAPSPDDVGSAEEDQPASAPVKAKPAGDVEAAKTAELM